MNTTTLAELLENVVGDMSHWEADMSNEAFDCREEVRLAIADLNKLPEDVEKWNETQRDEAKDAASLILRSLWILPIHEGYERTLNIWGSNLDHEIQLASKDSFPPDASGQPAN